jgi:hypothetical protein
MQLCRARVHRVDQPGGSYTRAVCGRRPGGPPPARRLQPRASEPRSSVHRCANGRAAAEEHVRQDGALHAAGGTRGGRHHPPAHARDDAAPRRTLPAGGTAARGRGRGARGRHGAWVGVDRAGWRRRAAAALSDRRRARRAGDDHRRQRQRADPAHRPLLEAAPAGATATGARTTLLTYSLAHPLQQPLSCSLPYSAVPCCRICGWRTAWRSSARRSTPASRWVAPSTPWAASCSPTPSCATTAPSTAAGCTRRATSRCTTRASSATWRTSAAARSTQRRAARCTSPTRTPTRTPTPTLAQPQPQPYFSSES